MKLQGINKFRDQDFEKILQSSPICNKHIHDDYVLFELESKDISDCTDVFHPKNNSGIILLDDDYLFGIRCDHLVWIDGKTWRWYYEDEFSCRMDNETDAVMLIGNHKGGLLLKLIVFMKNVEETD